MLPVAFLRISAIPYSLPGGGGPIRESTVTVAVGLFGGEPIRPLNCGCTYRIGRPQPSNAVGSMGGCVKPTRAPAVAGEYSRTILGSSPLSAASAAGTPLHWSMNQPTLLLIRLLPPIRASATTWRYCPLLLFPVPGSVAVAGGGVPPLLWMYSVRA